jgi:hypothetical protein
MLWVGDRVIAFLNCKNVFFKLLVELVVASNADKFLKIIIS